MSRINKPGINNRFINCRMLINPINEMNKSPHDRPNVSTNVANKPELNVPVANAVGTNFDIVEPLYVERVMTRIIYSNTIWK